MADVNESPRSGSNAESRPESGPSLLRRLQSALDLTGPQLSQPGRELKTIRGLSDPARSSFSCKSLVEQFPAKSEQRKQLEAVFHLAQLDGCNLGKDLEELIPLFKGDPGLLNRLYKVAQAQELFGISAKDCSKEEFELMKREFLFELIRASVSPGLLIQGETSTCPTSVLRGMESAKSKIVTACDLALKNIAVMADDSTVTFDGEERFIKNAEKVSGIKLSDNTVGYSRPLDSVTARMPSFFMALVTATIHEKFDDNRIDVEDGHGLESVARLARALSGKKAVCWCPAPGDEKQDLLAHIYGQIKQMRAVDDITGGIDTDNPAGVGVAVAMHWCDVQAGKNGKVLHGKHCLRAIGVKSIGNDEYVVLRNPIGDYVDVEGSKREGRTRFHPPRKPLGDGNITWIVGDNPGEVYIKRDVFERNLIAAVVYDKEILNLVGSDTLVVGGGDYPAVDYIVPKAVDPKTSDSKKNSRDSSANQIAVFGAEKPLTAGEWFALEALHKQEESRARSRQTAVKTPDSGYYAARLEEETARRKEGIAEEIAEEIIAQYDASMSLMFSDNRINTIPLAATPPPPPQNPPPQAKAPKTTLAV
jgi:hypothetical protein